MEGGDRRVDDHRWFELTGERVGEEWKDLIG